jgi:uncharacterized repeat protein (TIGR01451 family)
VTDVHIRLKSGHRDADAYRARQAEANRPGDRKTGETLMKLKILLLTMLAMLCIPQAASAACPVGIGNDLTIVPPAQLAEGQTQGHTYRVTACTPPQKITVEWVKIRQSNRPWMMDATNRDTILPETVQSPVVSYVAGVYTHTGSTAWTIPVGTPDGHYGVITRYYAVGSAYPEAQGASSFSVVTPDLCSNLDGKQQSVPTGYDEAGGVCTVPVPVIDVCSNIDGVQITVPLGYDEAGGICTLPVDLCSNIAGNQTSVPLGHVEAGGICTVPPTVISDPPPTDLCPNLDGAQGELPTGYEIVAGECKLIATPTGDNPQPLKPSPWIRKVANKRIVTTGGQVRFTITLGNRGPGTLKGVRMCDRLPAGTTYVSHTGSGAFTNGSICWNVGNLASGSNRSYRLTLRVSASRSGKRLRNTACMTSTNAAKKCASATVKVRVRYTQPGGGVTG